jgi:hypothetical protein
VVVSVRSTASGSQVGITSNEFTITRAVLAEDPQLTIWPTSGGQGSQIYLVAANFPPMSQLEYSIGRSIEDMDILGSTWTEINGTLAVVITIPTEAEVGEEWIFGVETVAEPQVEAISPVFTVVEAEEP